MTLQEFIDKAFRNPASKESVKIYVFDDEDSADSWIEYKYNGVEKYDFEIAMVIQSDYRAEVFLKDKWLNSEIQQFYVVEADTIAVVVNVEVEQTDTHTEFRAMLENFFKKEVKNE